MFKACKRISVSCRSVNAQDSEDPYVDAVDGALADSESLVVSAAIAAGCCCSSSSSSSSSSTTRMRFHLLTGGPSAKSPADRNRRLDDGSRGHGGGDTGEMADGGRTESGSGCRITRLLGLRIKLARMSGDVNGDADDDVGAGAVVGDDGGGGGGGNSDGEPSESEPVSGPGRRFTGRPDLRIKIAHRSGDDAGDDGGGDGGGNGDGTIRRCPDDVDGAGKILMRGPLRIRSSTMRGNTMEVGGVGNGGALSLSSLPPPPRSTSRSFGRVSSVSKRARCLFPRDRRTCLGVESPLIGNE